MSSYDVIGTMRRPTVRHMAPDFVETLRTLGASL
jgi:hypothetical protein